MPDVVGRFVDRAQDVRAAAGAAQHTIIDDRFDRREIAGERLDQLGLPPENHHGGAVSGF
jgi:hypothetical protein